MLIDFFMRVFDITPEIHLFVFCVDGKMRL